jgi:hypothetical protein
LKCFKRKTDELTPIFGCSGLGIAGLDYCYNETAASVGVTLAPVAAPTAGESAISDTESAVDEGATVVETPPTEEEQDYAVTNVQATLTDRESVCSAEDPCIACEGDCLGNEKIASNVWNALSGPLATIPA